MTIHHAQIGPLKVQGELFGSDLARQGHASFRQLCRLFEKDAAPLGIVMQVVVPRGRLPFDGPFLSIWIDASRPLARAFLAALGEHVEARRKVKHAWHGLRPPFEGTLFRFSTANSLLAWACLLTPEYAGRIYQQIASSYGSTGAVEFVVEPVSVSFGWPGLVRWLEEPFDVIGPAPIRGCGFPPFENPWNAALGNTALLALTLFAGLMMVRR